MHGDIRAPLCRSIVCLSCERNSVPWSIGKLEPRATVLPDHVNDIPTQSCVPYSINKLEEGVVALAASSHGAVVITSPRC